MRDIIDNFYSEMDEILGGPLGQEAGSDTTTSSDALAEQSASACLASADDTTTRVLSALSDFERAMREYIQVRKRRKQHNITEYTLVRFRQLIERYYDRTILALKKYENLSAVMIDPMVLQRMLDAVYRIILLVKRIQRDLQIDVLKDVYSSITMPYLLGYQDADELHWGIIDVLSAALPEELSAELYDDHRVLISVFIRALVTFENHFDKQHMGKLRNKLTVLLPRLASLNRTTEERGILVSTLSKVIAASYQQCLTLFGEKSAKQARCWGQQILTLVESSPLVEVGENSNHTAHTNEETIEDSDLLTSVVDLDSHVVTDEPAVGQHSEHGPHTTNNHNALHVEAATDNQNLDSVADQNSIDVPHGASQQSLTPPITRTMLDRPMYTPEFNFSEVDIGRTVVGSPEIDTDPPAKRVCLNSASDHADPVAMIGREPMEQTCETTLNQDTNRRNSVEHFDTQQYSFDSNVVEAFLLGGEAFLLGGIDFLSDSTGGSSQQYDSSTTSAGQPATSTNTRQYSNFCNNPTSFFWNDSSSEGNTGISSEDKLPLTM